MSGSHTWIFLQISLARHDFLWQPDAPFPHYVAGESFFYRETQPLFRQLETVSQRSGVSRGQAFEDFLTAGVAALAAETMEEEYLAMVERHWDGEPGSRSIDVMATMFAELVRAMTKTDGDILGDLFQSAVSHQESGQFFTPEPISQLMGQLTIGDDEKGEDGRPLMVSDPACGTGRMLLDAARQNPNVELCGTDIDARCAKISAINLGLRSHYGWIVCGNSLTLENRFAYRIAPFYHESPAGLRRGVIREVPVEKTPVASPSERSPGDLFASTSEKPTENNDEASIQLPHIMEIPRWVLRLEQQPPENDQQPESTGQPPPMSALQPPTASSINVPFTQGELF